MNKFFKIISLLVLIYGCSYKPILSNQKYNFAFNKIDTKGEKSINGFIKSNLINKSTGEEKFDILLNTTKNKKIISSDQKGDPLVFELTITLNYEIKKNNENIISETIKKKISYMTTLRINSNYQNMKKILKKIYLQIFQMKYL